MFRSMVFILACCLGTGALSAETKEAAVVTSTAAQDVLYTQILRPGAVKEYDGKTVRFDALFFNIALSNRDLPKKYSDSVRLILCAQTYASVCEGVYGNAVIARDKSAGVLELKNGDKVRITARASSSAMPASVRAKPEPVGPGEAPKEQPSNTKVNAQEPQDQLILEVESVETVK